MYEKRNELLKKWLKIDFFYVANKAGLITRKLEADETLIYETIRYLDYETIIEKDPEVNYVITIIGLLWEHVDHDKYDIRPLVIKFLSRIGYPTSAIICDDKFDFDTCSFSTLPSWIDQVMSAMYQDKNEVLVADNKILLTDFQKKIWDKMDENKLIGISAPTSAGKSFVILQKIIDRLSREDFDVVYIVPTLSLVNQVTEDFHHEIKRLKISDCHIFNSFDRDHKPSIRNIYVLTQEKAIAAFTESEDAFSRNLVLVVDEIQNIERIEDAEDERAKILFDTLTEFRYKENVAQIILSGPRIEKVDSVGKGIFGIDACDITTVISPVVNLTYSIKKTGDNYYFKQYCSLCDDPMIEPIENQGLIKGYGQKGYTDSYLMYLNDFVCNVGDDSQNIIFAPTSNGARKIALSLQGHTDEHEKELISYYQSTIHKNYVLCSTLEKGVAFHHGKLPMHVRRTLEKAIGEKKIKNVVCTTTLLQGVNLPAQNIFIRNPHLYLRKMPYSAELTGYEMANLRGRAGRLLKDFVGRTYVMDEDEFSNTDGYEQVDLFDEVSKNLPSSYEQRFEEYKDFIEEALYNEKPVDGGMKKYGDLVSYIRQSVLRYGENSKDKLKDVGITLKKEQVAAIILKLDNLSVPRDICMKNRYWDPLVLDSIYNNFDEDLPNTPFQRGATAKVNRALRFLRDTKETATMYEKYIPTKFQSGQMRNEMVKLSMRWAKEEPLSEILDSEKYLDEDGADAIDETIELLENTVSFRIPLLLKPIFDMRNPKSNILTCMQTGSHNPITRSMIEMGVARETALQLTHLFFESVKIEDGGKETIENLIRSTVKTRYDELPYWVKVQVDFMI